MKQIFCVITKYSVPNVVLRSGTQKENLFPFEKLTTNLFRTKELFFSGPEHGSSAVEDLTLRDNKEIMSMTYYLPHVTIGVLPR